MVFGSNFGCARGLAGGFAAGIFMPGIELWSMPDMPCASAGAVIASDRTMTSPCADVTQPLRAGAH